MVLRDFSSAIGLMIIGIALVIVIGISYRLGYIQDSSTMGITETVKTAAIANTDYSSRLERGQLFILKEQFEQDFKDKISANNNVKLSEEATYEFDYLDNENGSTKAIRVSIKDGETEYQATYKVDISES